MEDLTVYKLIYMIEDGEFSLIGGVDWLWSQWHMIQAEYKDARFVSCNIVDLD